MNRNMKLALIDTSESSSLTLVNKALNFADEHGMVVALFDTQICSRISIPSDARVVVSKKYDHFFEASAHLGKAISDIEGFPYFRERVTDLFIISNLYTGDVVYKPKDVSLTFIAMPGSEGIEWFKGEYQWAKVFSWAQAEDEYDRA